MDRLEILRRGLTKDMLGLEVAPWFNPIVAKRDGYNVRTLDVFDSDTLMARAQADQNIQTDSYGKIEPVDYVGNAVEIADLVPAGDHGTFDYIISSHNFEHLPNPIRFLQGCQSLLKPDGRLIMAVPDGRACFDYFRAHTPISDWLEAYLENRSKPKASLLFDGRANHATRVVPGRGGFSEVDWTTPRCDLGNRSDPAQIWRDWQEGRLDAGYTDGHCSVFTPASFELLIDDCQMLGLSRFEVAQISPTQGVEFMVTCTLRPQTDAARSPEDRQRRRTELLHRVWEDHAMRVSRDPRLSLKDGLALWRAAASPLTAPFVAFSARVNAARRRAKARRKPG